MNLWDRMTGIRKIAKTQKWLYVPYRNIKLAIINKQRVKALQKNGRELVLDIERVLGEVGCLYFADYGTLLGIVRDKKFLTYDNDVDYGIVASEDFSWIKLEQGMNQAGYSKIRQFTYHNAIKEQTYCKGTLTVDLFLHETENDNIVAHGFFCKDGFTYQYENERHVRKVTYVKVDKTKKIPFMDIEVTIPENAEEYLASAYTERWRTPDPKWSDDSTERKNVIELQDFGYGEFYRRKR